MNYARVRGPISTAELTAITGLSSRRLLYLEEHGYIPRRQIRNKWPPEAAEAVFRVTEGAVTTQQLCVATGLDRSQVLVLERRGAIPCRLRRGWWPPGTVEAASAACELLPQRGVVRVKAEYRKTGCAGVDFDVMAFTWFNESDRYWLGFLMGDGSVSRYVVRLSLAVKDRQHVERFARHLGMAVSQVKLRRNLTGLGQDKAEVELGSKLMAERLAALGVKPRKTWSAVADARLAGCRHFWRGFIDADGWLTPFATRTDGISGRLDKAEIGAVSHVGSRMLEQLAEFVAAECGRALTVTIRSRDSGSTKHVQATGRLGVEVMRLLYADAGVALERKRERAMAWIGAPERRVPYRSLDVSHQVGALARNPEAQLRYWRAKVPTTAGDRWRRSRRIAELEQRLAAGK